jgi:protein-tyrosine-phosphatase
MAEALFNHYAAGRAQAFSAGTKPASHTDRTVVEVMLELGIDIRTQRPKMLTPEMMGDTDRVITMGCEVETFCPTALAPTEDWQLEDPEGRSIEIVREIRGEIEARVRKLIEEVCKKERVKV